MPAFVADLRKRQSVSALGLEFLILTTARTEEVIGGKKAELDRNAKVWTVPGDRMKRERPHRVPLCVRALAILDQVAELDPDSTYIFPGQKLGRPLSNMAFEMLLRRMKVDVTVHGFRSSFRDWAGEATTFPREVAEAALSHAVGDETERAYRRGDALEKRRKLMDAWAGFLATGNEAGKVVPFVASSGRSRADV
jgi:integrase